MIVHLGMYSLCTDTKSIQKEAKQLPMKVPVRKNVIRRCLHDGIIYYLEVLDLCNLLFIRVHKINNENTKVQNPRRNKINAAQ